MSNPRSQVSIVDALNIAIDSATHAKRDLRLGDTADALAALARASDAIAYATRHLAGHVKT